MITKRVLRERNLDVTAIDSNVLGDAMGAVIARAASQLAMESVMSLDGQLHPQLLKALNVNLIGVETPIAGGPAAWDDATLRDVETRHEDELAQLREECVTAIAELLAGYYKGYTATVVRDGH